MENENSTLLIGDMDINMLVGIYMYDQGKIKLEKLANMLNVPKNQIDDVLEKYRDSPAYKVYYSEISSYSNSVLELKNTDILGKNMAEAADLIHSYQILSDRKVSPSEIIEDGRADSLLASDYFKQMFGNELEIAVKKAGTPEMDYGWKRMMAATLVQQCEMNKYQALQRYSDFMRQPDNGDNVREAEVRRYISDTFTRSQKVNDNYARTFGGRFVLPQVADMLSAARNDGHDVAGYIHSNRNSRLVIGQFLDQMTGVNGLGVRLGEGNHLDFNEKVMDELVKTEWFRDLVGTDLSGVQSRAFTQAQFEVAASYVQHVSDRPDRLAAENTGEEVSPDKQKELLEVVYERLSTLNTMSIAVNRTEIQAARFAMGKAELPDNTFFESEHFRTAYGQDLSFMNTPLTEGDKMVIGAYRDYLDNRIFDLSSALSGVTDQSRLHELEQLDSLQALLDKTDARLLELSEGKAGRVDELGESSSNDRAVQLLYSVDTGRFFTIPAGMSLSSEQSEKYHVIEKYTTVRRSLDFTSKLNEKLSASKSGSLSLDNIRHELRVYKRLPENRKDIFTTMNLLTNAQATVSEHPDLTAMRALAFEHQKKVDFDLANAGVKDVIKTDANNIEYQQKVDKDSGKSVTNGIGR